MKRQVLYFFLIISLSANAQITIDGTLSPALNLSGPNYQIGPDLGQQQGGNLFHSFKEFNLQRFESVTFYGPHHIQNVISRVTGGNPSNIDGLIRSTIPNADMYFLNPYGIVFGPNAQLDVLGSFHASTADYLRLKDGGHFDARQPNNSLLTVAPVETFGFLSNSLAPISVTGKNIRIVKKFLVNELNIWSYDFFRQEMESNYHSAEAIDQKIQTVNSDMDRLNAKLAALDIDVRVEPIHDADEIGTLFNRLIIFERELEQTEGLRVPQGETLSLIGGRLQLNQANLSAPLGRINLIAGSSEMTQAGFPTGHIKMQDTRLSTSSDSGGSIYIRGGQFEMQDSEIDVTSLSHKIEPNLDIKVDDFMMLGGIIDSQTKGSGINGDINITANKMKFTDNARIRAIVNETGTATGENVNLTAQNLQLQAGSEIEMRTAGSGAGGRLRIKVQGQVNLSDNSAINIFTENTGNAGALELEAEQLLITASSIHAKTNSTGKGGNLYLKVADDVKLSDSSISISSEGTFGNGNAGVLKLEANQLIIDHSTISAITDSTEKGGNIQINAGDITLLNGHILVGTTIAGDAGIIEINAENLLMTEAASIKADTSGTGQGGSLYIKVKDDMQLINSNIYAQTTSVSENAGGAGTIELQVGKLRLSDGASIYITTQGSSQAGDIHIIAEEVELSGYSQIVMSSLSNDYVQIDAYSNNIDVYNALASLGLSEHELQQITSNVLKIRPSDLGFENVEQVIRTTLLQDTEFTGFEKQQVFKQLVELINTTDSSLISLALFTPDFLAGIGLDSIEIDQLRMNALRSLHLDLNDLEQWVNTKVIDKVVDVKFDDVEREQAFQILENFFVKTFTSEGNAGNLHLETNHLNLLDHSKITADTSMGGIGGNVNIQANQINLKSGSILSANSQGYGDAGKIELDVKGHLQMTDSSIRTEAMRMGGGDININSSGYIYLHNSDISTSVKTEKGDGGNITTEFPTFVIMDNGKMIAQAVEGHGGDIYLKSEQLIASPESLVSASSKLGLDGNVEIESPTVNLDEFLVALPGHFLEASNQLQPPCTVARQILNKRKKSSFVLKNFVGSPPSPSDWQSNWRVLPPLEDEVELPQISSRMKDNDTTTGHTVLGCQFDFTHFLTQP